MFFCLAFLFRKRPDGKGSPCPSLRRRSDGQGGRRRGHVLSGWGRLGGDSLFHWCPVGDRDPDSFPLSVSGGNQEQRKSCRTPPPPDRGGSDVRRCPGERGGSSNQTPCLSPYPLVPHVWITPPRGSPGRTDPLRPGSVLSLSFRHVPLSPALLSLPSGFDLTSNAHDVTSPSTVASGGHLRKWEPARSPRPG